MWRRCEINVDLLLVWQLLPIFLLRTGHYFCTFIDIVHENRDLCFVPTKFQVIWIRLSKTLWPKIKHFKPHGFCGTIHVTNATDSRVGITEQKEVSSIWRSQNEQFISRLGAGEKLKIDHFGSWYIKRGRNIYIHIYL